MNRLKKVQVLLVLVIGLMSFGATAWACTAFTTLSGPQSGLAESEITVEGESLIREKDAGKEVELRWNKVDGPLLAEATTTSAGTLSAAITIPDVAPGVYFIQAVDDGRGVARMSFEVTAPAASEGPVVDFRVPDLSARTDAPVPTSTDSSTATGIAMLSVGLVLLAVGAGLVVSNRRRAAASAITDSDSTTV